MSNVKDTICGCNKPVAYFKRVVTNSRKNEYRQNDNAAKYISPIGLMLERNCGTANSEEEFDDHMAYSSVEDWVLTIGNESLHSALKGLQEEELKLVYLITVIGCTQKQAAIQIMISQQAVSRKWRRIRKKLKILMKEV